MAQKSFFKKYKYLLFIVLLLCLGLGLYLIYGRDNAPTYMTVNAQMRDIKQEVFATGLLSGKTEVDVGAQVSGQIEKIYVKIGDNVKKGDLLCQIDPSTQENKVKASRAQKKLIEAQIKAKKADINRLKLDLARQTELKKLDAVSDKVLQEARANYEIALANLEELEAQYEIADIEVEDAITNLGYTKILAPMDGTVYAVSVEEGQTVNANQTTPTILKLAKLDVMTVETEISEADVVKVKPGLDCQFTILGLPNHYFDATLDSIEVAPASAQNSSNQTTSTSTTSEAVYYNALLDVDNKEGLLRIDMTAQVNITIASVANVLSIPLTALRTDDYQGNGSVYILDKDNNVIDVPVSLGLRDDQFIEVKNGLDLDDVIVLGDDVATAEADAMNSLRRRPHMM